MIEARDAGAVTSRRFWSRLLAPLDQVDRNAAVILVVAGGCYLASHFEASSDFYNTHLARHLTFGRFQDLSASLYWLGASNVVFGLVPLGVLVALHEPLSEYGLGFGRRRLGLTVAGLFLAVMLPLTALVAQTHAFAGQYPIDQGARKDWAHFWIFEALYVGYFAGWEIFHRGFLLFGLRRRIGDLAIFVQAVPFAVMHFGKPEPEAWGSLFAGIALGVLAVRAQSVWYGFGLHGAVAFIMDLLQSWPQLRHH